jgi:hypothetical protein
MKSVAVCRFFIRSEEVKGNGMCRTCKWGTGACLENFIRKTEKDDTWMIQI